ncbi:MAG: class aldolase/adducin family protein [Solirubrobacterales bacterium]|nr:class aldolase/adducin family protein [Solirubrobacterales bacterium]
MERTHERIGSARASELPDVVGEQVIAGARTLVAAGLVVGTVGNVSARVGNRVRITPTRCPYDELTTDDLVTIDLDGRVVAGRHGPSREVPLHLAAYRARADVRAVVHTHSPYATAWSFLGIALEPHTEEIGYYGIGPVRTCPPADAGSHALADAAIAGLGDSKATLLGGHGVVAVGATVDEAIVVARAIEHQAQIAWLLRGAGPVPGVAERGPQR